MNGPAETSSIYGAFIDVFLLIDSSRRNNGSNIEMGRFSFGLDGRYGSSAQQAEGGVYVNEPLVDIIEVEIPPFFIPNRGQYTFHTDTSALTLVPSQLANPPPLFDRMPYRVISIEYEEIKHLIPCLQDRKADHFMFLVTDEGERLRLTPLFGRITFKSPQRLDKILTLTFTDPVRSLPFSNDIYDVVTVYGVIPPGETSPLIAFNIGREVLPNERIYPQGVETANGDLSLYLNNAGGLYVAPDFRRPLDDATLVFTNPLIKLPSSMQAKTADFVTSAPLPGKVTYSNGVGGVGATLTGDGPIGNGITAPLPTNPYRRLLVKDEVRAETNGLYDVVAANPFILRRTRGADSSRSLFPGMFFLVGGLTYNIPFSPSSRSIDIGNVPIKFNLFSVSSAKDTLYRCLVSPPCTVIVSGRRFFIPIRFRKHSKTATNFIMPT